MSLGAPLVAIGRDVLIARAEFTLPRIYYGVTAIARFEGRRCVISFEDPLAVETGSLQRANTFRWPRIYRAGCGDAREEQSEEI